MIHVNLLELKAIVHHEGTNNYSKQKKVQLKESSLIFFTNLMPFYYFGIVEWGLILFT